MNATALSLQREDSQRVTALNLTSFTKLFHFG